jgi:hypothetical protein
LQENDKDIISKNDFIKEVNKASNNNNCELYKNIDLQFGNIYLEYCLVYLDKIKKIAIFNIEENKKKIEFIKLILNKYDFPSEKDKIIAKLLLKCDFYQNKIRNIDNNIIACVEKARIFLQKGDKISAKSWIIKKNNFEKTKKIYDSKYMTFLNQIYNIRNAENHAKDMEALKLSNSLLKESEANNDEFVDILANIKEQNNLQIEINNDIKELAGNYNEDEINKELEKLANENRNNEIEGQNLEFPFPNNENMPLNPFPLEMQLLYKHQ